MGKKLLMGPSEKTKKEILTCARNCVWLHELTRARLMWPLARFHDPGPLWSGLVIDQQGWMFLIELWRPLAAPCHQSTTLLCEDLLTCGFDTLRLWQPWVVHLQNGGIQPHVVRAVRNVLETSLLLVHLFKWITLGFTFGVVEFQRHYYYDIIIIITILALKMALLG